MPRSLVAESATFVKKTATTLVEDHVWRHAAAVSFYTLFALGPFLVLVRMLAGAVVGPEAANAAILAPFHQLLGEKGGKALDDVVAGADRNGPGAWGLVLGGLGLLVGAAGAFGQLKEALNAIWDVDRKPRASWGARLWTALRENLLSVGGVLAALFLLVVSLALGGFLAALGNPAFAFVAGVLVVWLAIALLFKLAPDADVAWHDAIVGALVTAILFALAQALLGAFLRLGPFATSYGVMSAALVLLLWVYVSAVATLFGAGFTQVWANRHGHGVRPDADAMPRDEARRARSQPSQEGR